MAGTSDLVNGVKAVREASAAYVKAERMYTGDFPEVYSSEKVKLLLARSGVDDMDRINFAHIPVNALVNKLRLSTVTATNEQDNEDEDATKALDEIWRRNQLFREFTSINRNAAKFGDAYIFVWPALDSEGKTVGVDVFYNSPLTTRAIYDEDNPLTVRYVVKCWTEEVEHEGSKAEVAKATLYYSDRIEYWETEPGKKGNRAEDWKERQEDQPNEHGRIPVFHLRSDSLYGVPVHFYAYGPQQLANKTLLALASSIDFQSWPQRYYLVDPTKDDAGRVGGSGNFEREDDDDDPEAPAQSQLRSHPNEVWELIARGAGQFEAANPDVFLKPMERAVKSMAQATETPFHYFDPSGDAPSGESLRTANAPLDDKAEKWQEMLGQTWDEAFTFALELMDITANVKVQWKPVRVVTDKEGWDTARTKQDAGVPQEQTLLEAGYTREQVAEWLQDDDRNLDARLRQLATMADMMQKFGQAVSLGVADEQQVKEVIERFLKEAAGEHEDVPAS